MSSFKELGISEELRQALKELSIYEPTEIQIKSIPILLSSNVDFVAQAPTGTGKTAAFGLPLIANVDPNNRSIQGLILTPTRELGIQIQKQLFKFTKYLPNKIFTESLYGGEHIVKQIDALKRPTQIVVATPGRLKDLCTRKAIDLSQVRTLVLDEADEMLTMGFKEDLEFIMSQTNAKRNNWMFSATMPKDILDLIESNFRKSPTRVRVDKNNLVNKQIEHRYVVCEIDNKVNIIVQFLNSRKGERGVIFTKTKKGAQKLAAQLKAKNFLTDAIHGDLLQKERDKVMRAFVNLNIDILVATDVAARGIDVKDLAFVVHHMLPEQEEYYTHRSGRTARAGKDGLSLSLITQSEEKYLKNLGKKLGIMIKQL